MSVRSDRSTRRSARGVVLRNDLDHTVRFRLVSSSIRDSYEESTPDGESPFKGPTAANKCQLQRVFPPNAVKKKQKNFSKVSPKPVPEKLAALFRPEDFGIRTALSSAHFAQLCKQIYGSQQLPEHVSLGSLHQRQDAEAEDDASKSTLSGRQSHGEVKKESDGLQEERRDSRRHEEGRQRLNSGLVECFSGNTKDGQSKTDGDDKVKDAAPAEDDEDLDEEDVDDEFPDDGYDYYQHLALIGGGTFIARRSPMVEMVVPIRSSRDDTSVSNSLNLSNKAEESRLLPKVVEADSEVLDALRNADEWEDLNDDFIQQAIGYEMLSHGEEEEDVSWPIVSSRMDCKQGGKKQPQTADGSSVIQQQQIVRLTECRRNDFDVTEKRLDDDDMIDVSDGERFRILNDDRESGRQPFCVLREVDMQFEKVLEEYGDDNIGELVSDSIVSSTSITQQHSLRSAADVVGSLQSDAERCEKYRRFLDAQLAVSEEERKRKQKKDRKETTDVFSRRKRPDGAESSISRSTRELRRWLSEEEREEDAKKERRSIAVVQRPEGADQSEGLTARIAVVEEAMVPVAETDDRRREKEEEEKQSEEEGLEGTRCDLTAGHDGCDREETQEWSEEEQEEEEEKEEEMNGRDDWLGKLPSEIAQKTLRLASLQQEERRMGRDWLLRWEEEEEEQQTANNDDDNDDNNDDDEYWSEDEEESFENTEFDCQTVLSTYSNVFNRPYKIPVCTKSSVKQRHPIVRLVGPHQLPVDYLRSNLVLFKQGSAARNRAVERQCLFTNHDKRKREPLLTTSALLTSPAETTEESVCLTSVGHHRLRRRTSGTPSTASVSSLSPFAPSRSLLLLSMSGGIDSSRRSRRSREQNGEELSPSSVASTTLVTQHDKEHEHCGQSHHETLPLGRQRGETATAKKERKAAAKNQKRETRSAKSEKKLLLKKAQAEEHLRTFHTIVKNAYDLKPGIRRFRI